MRSLEWEADVAVVGAGPAGCVCATLLVQQGYRVVLIDNPSPGSSWPELLSPEAVLFLRRIGAYESIVPSGIACSGLIDTSNATAENFQDFELTRCSAGLAIDRAILVSQLKNFVVSQGVEVRSDSASLGNPGGQTSSFAEVWLASAARPLRVRFVVDATGTSSTFTPRAYRQRLRFDRLIAIQIPLASWLGRMDRMVLSSSSEGWWYALSTSQQSSAAVFITDSDLLSAKSPSLLEYLDKQFREGFRERGEFTLNDKPPSASLRFRNARTTCRRRLLHGHWLPIGDAAYSLDPILGGGVLRSFCMAEAAAPSISEYLQSGNPLGLQEFATRNLTAFSEGLSNMQQVYSIVKTGDPEELAPFWKRRVGPSAFRPA